MFPDAGSWERDILNLKSRGKHFNNALKDDFVFWNRAIRWVLNSRLNCWFPGHRLDKFSFFSLFFMVFFSWKTFLIHWFNLIADSYYTNTFFQLLSSLAVHIFFFSILSSSLSFQHDKPSGHPIKYAPLISSPSCRTTKLNIPWDHKAFLTLSNVRPSMRWWSCGESLWGSLSFSLSLKIFFSTLYIFDLVTLYSRAQIENIHQSQRRWLRICLLPTLLEVWVTSESGQEAFLFSKSTNSIWHWKSKFGN